MYILKTKFKISLLTALVGFIPLSSCINESRENTKLPEKISAIESPTELLPIINKFQTILEKNQKEKVTNLVIRYSTNKSFDYENSARGLCVRVSPTPIIYLFERDWIGSKAKSKDIQELSLLHLIGHCAYNLKHNEKINNFKEDGKTYKHPISLMYPNFNWNKFSPKFLEKNQQDYHDKLIEDLVKKEIK